jgi:hypothetical protein
MNISKRDESAGLETLATRINEEHRACDEALREGLRHAVNAGELLIEAKSLCPYGAWGVWLEENFEGSDRTARAYMRVARELPALEEGKRQRVADLSFRDALAELSSPRDEPPRGGEDDEPYTVVRKSDGTERVFQTIEEYADAHGFRLSPPLLVDEEFHNLLPPLQDYERAGLEKSILARGVTDALDVWGNTIVDGHARYEICVRHGIPYLVFDLDFPDRDAAKLWIIDNQLGRKNLSDADKLDLAETRREMEGVA